MAALTSQDELPIRQARAGDPDAWDKLFHRYQKPLYVYVHELTRQEQTSLDIVQECFIRAARHIDQLSSDEKFGSWLFGIAHQRCLDYWRQSQRKQVFEADDDLEGLADSEDDPSVQLIRKEQRRQFLEAIESLGELHRSVVLLYYLDEFSVEEIAQIIGIDPGTVKSRLHYARKAIRHQLKGEV